MSIQKLADESRGRFMDLFGAKDVLYWVVRAYLEEERGRETLTLAPPHPTQDGEFAREFCRQANSDARFQWAAARSFVFTGTFVDVLEVLAGNTDPGGLAAEAFAHIYEERPSARLLKDDEDAAECHYCFQAPRRVFPRAQAEEQSEMAS